MALSEKYRTRLYEHFVEHVGEEAAEAMLAQFPSRDADEPATKDFVALQVAHLDGRFAALRPLIDHADAGRGKPACLAHRGEAALFRPRHRDEHATCGLGEQCHEGI